MTVVYVREAPPSTGYLALIDGFPIARVRRSPWGWSLYTLGGTTLIARTQRRSSPRSSLEPAIVSEARRRGVLT